MCGVTCNAGPGGRKARLCDCQRVVQVAQRVKLPLLALNSHKELLDTLRGRSGGHKLSFNSSYTHTQVCRRRGAWQASWPATDPAHTSYMPSTSQLLHTSGVHTSYMEFAHHAHLQGGTARQARCMAVYSAWRRLQAERALLAMHSTTGKAWAWTATTA